MQEGATAAFSVVASGTAPLTYQWKKGGVVISGAGAASYTTPSTVLADTGSSFTVTVSNVGGSVTSSAATLTVNPTPPTIITQPASVTVTAGATATFTVVAGGNPPFTYQWKKGGVDIGGATSASYTTPATVPADSGGSFTVTVTHGGVSITSSAAILTVQSVPPAISLQPANQTVQEGAAATFSVVASGTGPLTYQWKKGGVVISGAGAASYTTPSTVLADTGSSFTVTVSNAGGSVTSSAATLTVNPTPPTITTQPASVTVTAGATATFTVVAGGNPPFTYQWKKGGINIGGATSASYTTPATVPADSGGSFTVTVTHGGIAVTSSAAILTVQSTPAFTLQPAGTTVTAGATATFTAAATGNPAPSYQWYRGSTLLPGQTSAALTLAATTLADAGSYTVTATNSLGTATSNAAVLVVNQAPVFTVQPAGTTVTAGATATFTAAATGNPAPSYQWYRGSTLLLGQTSATLTLAATTLADAGSYTVTATNSLGTATSAAAILTVRPTFRVSGRVTLVDQFQPSISGVGIPGVTVSLDTAPNATTTVTDGTGNFSIPGIPDGTYTLTPSMPAGTKVMFLPPTKTVAVSGSDLANLQLQAALGYTVSGTVSYSGAKTGRIYLRLDGGRGGAPGVSIPGPGTFAIRGVVPGTYTLTSWMDGMGKGNPNAANPTGSRAGVVVGFGDAFGADVSLVDPAAIDLSSLTPVLNSVAPMDGGVLLNWKPLWNAQGVELADSYLIQWSTNGFSTISGSATVAARGKLDTEYFGSTLFVSGLANGTPAAFRVYAKAGATTSASSNQVTATPAAAAGGNAISGTINFTGPATGPMYVVLFDTTTGQPFAMKVASPVSPQAYTVAGVPNGTYAFLVMVDQNGNGLLDIGEGSNTGGYGTIVVTANITNHDLTLPPNNAVVNAATQHQIYTVAGATYEIYGVWFDALPGMKLPVNVALQMGSLFFDVGLPDRGGFNYWANLGAFRPGPGTASVQVGYPAPSATADTFPLDTSKMLDTFATNLAPVTPTAAGTMPTFSWGPPTPAPTFSYTYRLWVRQKDTGASIWSVAMPSAQLSVAYGAAGGTPAIPPALTTGVTYLWAVEVIDLGGNSTVRMVEYTP
ncbi:MAG TPA: immunoglobulin domain-containing protein [Geothrix sp.]